MKFYHLYFQVIILCLDPCLYQFLQVELKTVIDFFSHFNFQCFFCPTEESFDSLCLTLSARLIRGHSTPMFEIRQSLPAHMQEDFCQPPAAAVRSRDSDELPSCSEDEEFEML